MNGEIEPERLCLKIFEIYCPTFSIVTKNKIGLYMVDLPLFKNFRWLWVT